MSEAFTGGCACGAIRYACTAEPLAMHHCHCRDCQRASGTGHGSNLMVAKAATTITGEARFYEVVAASGRTAGRLLPELRHAGLCAQLGPAGRAVPDGGQPRRAGPVPAAESIFHRKRAAVGHDRPDAARC